MGIKRAARELGCNPGGRQAAAADPGTGHALPGAVAPLIGGSVTDDLHGIHPALPSEARHW